MVWPTPGPRLLLRRRLLLLLRRLLLRTCIAPLVEPVVLEEGRAAVRLVLRKLRGQVPVLAVPQRLPICLALLLLLLLLQLRVLPPPGDILREQHLLARPAALVGPAAVVARRGWERSGITAGNRCSAHLAVSVTITAADPKRCCRKSRFTPPSGSTQSWAALQPCVTPCTRTMAAVSPLSLITLPTTSRQWCNRGTQVPTCTINGVFISMKSRQNRS
jgi:hypothetical protein